MKTAAQFLDQRQVRRNFARAAATYDQVAVLQREVGRRMLERLDYVRPNRSASSTSAAAPAPVSPPCTSVIRRLR